MYNEVGSGILGKGGNDNGFGDAVTGEVTEVTVKALWWC